MTFNEVAQSTLRAQYYDSAIKGIAERTYKFKQAVTINSSSAWNNYFFRESTTILSGQSGNAIKGIPRGADFPQASVSWERVQTTIQKYGLEENIPYEDLISDEIGVEERTLIKIAEGVAKAVDDEIFSVLTESLTPASIQSIDVGGKQWNVSSGAIIDDLLHAKQLIAEYNYPTENLMAFVSPADFRYINNYIAEKGAQFPQLGNDVASNGNQGRLAGIRLVVSNSVTASYALVVVPQRCATWKALKPLTTETKDDPFKTRTIRSVEFGVTQLTDPKAVVLIKGTQY